MSERTDVVIYTQGWNQDTAAVPEDGAPTSQVKGRMFVNGVEAAHYVSARVLTRSDDFLLLSVRLYASTLRVVPLADLSDLSTVLPEPPLPGGDDRRARVRAALAADVDLGRLPGLDRTVDRVLEALNAP